MVTTRWAICLWPGLPQLWRGSWVGLLLAMTFAGLLNVVLMTSFGWTELVAPGARATSWAVLLAFWALATLVSYRAIGRRDDEPEEVDEDNERLLVEAQCEYLRGNWLDAERLLRQLLRNNGGDVDARLMLATLLRHIGRVDEARQELDRLVRLEAAAKWQFEIEQERRQIERIESVGDFERKSETSADEENRNNSTHVIQQEKTAPLEESTAADAA